MDALGCDVHADGKFSVSLSTLYAFTGIRLALHHIGRDGISFYVLGPSLGHNNPAPTIFEMPLSASTESLLHGLLMEFKVEVLEQLDPETAHKILAAVEWEPPRGASNH